MTSNKKLNPIVTELFIRGRNLNISIFFKQSFFKVPKKARLNTMHLFITNSQTKKNFNKLQQITNQILTLKTLLKSVKNTNTAEKYYFLVNDTTSIPAITIR